MSLIIVFFYLSLFISLTPSKFYWNLERKAYLWSLAFQIAVLYWLIIVIFITHSSLFSGSLSNVFLIGSYNS